MSPDAKSDMSFKKRSKSAFNSTNKFMATSDANVLSNSKNYNAQDDIKRTRKQSANDHTKLYHSNFRVTQFDHAKNPERSEYFKMGKKDNFESVDCSEKMKNQLGNNFMARKFANTDKFSNNYKTPAVSPPISTVTSPFASKKKCERSVEFR